MNKFETLKELLVKEFIPDLEEYIDDIFTIIAEKKDDDNIKEDLEESQELLKNFKEIVKDIDNEELSLEEGVKILEELSEIKDEYQIQGSDYEDDDEEE